MWSKSLLIIALQLSASGADAYFTNRNLEHNRWGKEYDPISAPFMGSRGSRIAYASTTTGLKLSLDWMLARKGRKTLYKAASAWGIADSGFGAIYSATHAPSGSYASQQAFQKGH